jgi:hypothetical protein
VNATTQAAQAAITSTATTTTTTTTQPSTKPNFFSTAYWRSTPKPSAPPKSSSQKTPSIKSASSTTEPIGEATLEAQPTQESNTSIPCPSNPFWKKFAAILPILGEISSFLCQKSLDEYTLNAVPNESQIEAWKIKREYHGISIVRSVVEVAIVARIVALGILGINTGIALTSIPIILLASYIYKCIQANRMIKELTPNVEASNQ